MFNTKSGVCEESLEQAPHPSMSSSIETGQQLTTATRYWELKNGVRSSDLILIDEYKRIFFLKARGSNSNNNNNNREGTFKPRHTVQTDRTYVDHERQSTKAPMPTDRRSLIGHITYKVQHCAAAASRTGLKYMDKPLSG